MQTQSAYRPSPGIALLRLDDLDTTFRVPLVYDLTLARALGYEHARNVRRLIKANRAELETHGELVAVNDRTGGTGDLLSVGANARTVGRPGTAFYLNEGQALVICALTRTPIGARVRGELIRVFMLQRAGKGFRRCADNLAPGERRALRQILQNADVVMAPSYVETGRNSPNCGAGLDTPIGSAADGHIPYLLAPITESILETLAEFEADDADYEPEHEGHDLADASTDREASDCDSEGDGDCDLEDGHDREGFADDDCDNTDDTPDFTVRH